MTGCHVVNIFVLLEDSFSNNSV